MERVGRKKELSDRVSREWGSSRGRGFFGELSDSFRIGSVASPLFLGVLYLADQFSGSQYSQHIPQISDSSVISTALFGAMSLVSGTVMRSFSYVARRIENASVPEKKTWRESLFGGREGGISLQNLSFGEERPTSKELRDARSAAMLANEDPETLRRYLVQQSRAGGIAETMRAVGAGVPFILTPLHAWSYAAGEISMNPLIGLGASTVAGVGIYGFSYIPKWWGGRKMKRMQEKARIQRDYRETGSDSGVNPIFCLDAQ